MMVGPTRIASGSVVVAGALTRRSHAGGHVWALIHWALAFRRLGWRVAMLDTVEHPAMASPFLPLMERFGLRDDCALLVGDADCVGLDRTTLLDRVRSADLLLNVMGYCTDPDVLAAARRRVFLDIDPGFGQMWWARGDADVFAGHDVFVTVGGRVGRDDCRVPTCGHRWIPTLPPVALDHWPARTGGGRGFTSVASWRGPFDPVEYRGERFGLRVHEFRRFVDLPRRTGLGFEVALDIDDADGADRRRLAEGGWRLVDPREVAGGPDAYRAYLQESSAEFQVAKNMYVAARTGWFSDRTACYLASGRPAVVQDTGLDGVIETGRGLLAYDGLEEAADATREVAADRAAHGRAARDLAEAYLDGPTVLRRILPEIAA